MLGKVSRMNELKLIGPNSESDLTIEFDYDTFCIQVHMICEDNSHDSCCTWLDCGQAKKLLEFLQEKLKDVR